MQRSQRGGLNGLQSGTKSDRQVNVLLSTLRGEQFRHAQNIRSKQERAARYPVARAHNRPTLPPLFGESFGDNADRDAAIPVQPAPFRNPGQPGHGGVRPLVTLIEGVPTYAYPDGAVPGPKPPRSWSPLFREKENEVEWRAAALSLFLSRSPPAFLSAGSSEHYVQPLTVACMRILLSICDTAESLAEIAPYIPSQLRRDLIRWCAVYKPLDTARLRVLCLDEGHADGELIVVGPQATLRPEFFSRGHAPLRSAGDETEEVSPEEDWEASPAFDTQLSLTALAVISTPLSTSTLLNFPRTLTHLALLKLPQPLPIHNLSRTCPFLEVLDLSFNPWLNTEGSSSGSPSSEISSLNRIEWSRWRDLKVVGLRACGVGRDIVKRINEARWVDVRVIGVDDDPFVTISNAQGNEIWRS